MSSDQPTVYYQTSAAVPPGSAPHQGNNQYYVQQGMMEPQFSQHIQQTRPPTFYQQRLPQQQQQQQQQQQPQFMTGPIPNAYQTVMYPPGYIQSTPYVTQSNPRPANTQYVNVTRVPTAMDSYIPANQYAGYQNPNLPAVQQVFSPYFQATYQVHPSYATGQPIPSPAQQPPYVIPSTMNSIPAPQQPNQIAQSMASGPHQTVEQPHIPTTQPITIPQTTSYSQNNQQPTRRERKPLLIIDPVSNRKVDLDVGSAGTMSTTPVNTAIPPTTAPTTIENRPNESSTAADSNTSNTKSNDDLSKIQKQTDFRRQFAAQLGDSAATHIEKNGNVSTTVSHDEPTGAGSTKSQTQTSSGSRSGSISRPKSPTPVTVTTSQESVSSKPSDQVQQSYPGIRTGTISDEKLSTKPNDDENKETRERSNSQKLSSENEVERKSTSDDVINKRDIERSDSTSKTTPLLSETESLECVTPPQTPTALISRSETNLPLGTAQRLRYDRDELIRIRDASNTLPIPDNLPDLDIIINRRDNARFSYPNYTGTNSHGRLNPPYNRQLSGSNHPSLNRYSNTQSHSSHDARRKQAIYISNEPDFSNRVKDPYKPIDQNKIDANNRVLREVKAILNKVTPQTYEKLQQKLAALEIDRYERLEGMITIFFSKAVDEPAFSFLYAKLCKQFQKKQVTVPGEDGRTVTHFFRQILLTRCQKEFENDYRQEIEYEKRTKEVETITDEKKRKEEDEKLQEDLLKAKRRKLGNIFFIGELFKLQMLTDTIMYDCIEYLLRDKTDEESLECLCRLLRTIGKELDAKASEKATNKANLEKHYRELDHIIKEQKASARIRFMIQDLIELRQASWVARRAETKPLTIDEIHEEVRLKRIQQEKEQERERQQRREQNRTGAGGNSYAGNNQQQYNDSRGSRGSGMKNQNNRNDDDRVENRFNVNTVRQLQSNDRRNQGPMTINLAPQRTWARGSGIDKKPEEDLTSTSRSGKPPAGPVQQLKGKSSSSQGNTNNPIQRQSSRELARENSYRDRENALQSLRKTTGGSGIHSPIHGAGNSSITNSREGSRNVSREQSRNTSRESSVSERASNASLTARASKSSALDSSTIINPDPSETTFDEEKIQARVHSLIEEFTENYSDSSDRPVKEALEDLFIFRTSNCDQQATVIRELFFNVLETKPRTRKAVGHLLDAALNEEILSNEAFLSGFNMIVELAPDLAVDIPLIWQYIGEILGAFIGAPTSNFHLLKPILNKVPSEKSKSLFQDIIRFATEFSSQTHLQKIYQLSGLSLDDYIDSSMEKDYEWLTENDAIGQNKETHSPRADGQLVKLFKSFNDPNSLVTDPDILNYIHEHMDPAEKFYIRNIVLSYLEACLINRDPQKKIQEDIAKKRMTVLNAIIQHKPEAEIQAVYAIQNFVNKLEHPPKMARLLFDIFYDEECVSEDAFFEWLKHPDQSETEGHAVVEISTKDFFTWLQQAETEVEEGEEEGN